MVVAVALVAVASAAPVVPAEKPTYKVESRGDNAVAAHAERGRTVLVVTSPRGLGWAEVRPVGGDWPELVTVRLRYADAKPFRGLEELTLTTDRIVVSGSARESGRMPFAFVGADGKSETPDLRPEIEAGTLKVTVEPQDAGLDVVLPARMLRGAARLRIGWTDFYRR